MENVNEEIKNNLNLVNTFSQLPKEIQYVVIQKTSFLPNTAKFGLRKNCILNDIIEMPKRLVCNEPVRFDIKNFKILCEKCEGTEEGKKARQKNYELKFAQHHNGCINPYQLKSVKEHIKETKIINCGAEN